MTAATLVVDARTPGGGLPNTQVRAELTDSDGTPVTGRLSAGGVIVHPVSGVTDTDGTLNLMLEPNAGITPDNTYYTVTLTRGDKRTRDLLVAKGTATETLVDAEVSSPSALGAAFGVGNLADVTDAENWGMADGYVLVFDQDTAVWAPADADSVATPAVGDLTGFTVGEQLAELDAKTSVESVFTALHNRIVQVEEWPHNFAGSTLATNIRVGQLDWTTWLNRTNCAVTAGNAIGGEAERFVTEAKLTVGTNAAAQTFIDLGGLSMGDEPPVFTLEHRFWIEDLATAAQDYFAVVGLADNLQFNGTDPVGEPTCGIYFLYDRANLGANWHGVCADNGTRTRVDTGVPAVAGAYRTFRIQHDGAGNVHFFVADGPVGASPDATVATNLPGASAPYGHQCGVQKTVGATVRDFYHDFFASVFEVMR